VVATDRKLVYCLSLEGDVLPGWPRSFSEQPAGLCMVPSGDGPFVALLTVSGEAFAWTPGGSPVAGWPVSAAGGEPCGTPLSADFDRDGSVEVAFLCGSTLSLYGPGGGIEQGFPAQLRGEPCGSPWLADMNSDGYPEVMVETSLGVEAFEASGAVLSDWPDAVEGDPDVLDYSRLSSGSGAQSFSGFFLRDGRTYICGPRGEPLEGFPVSTGDSPVGRPLLADLDADGDLDLCAADASGWAGLWGTSITGTGWFPGADYSGCGCWPEDLLPQLSQSASLLLPGSFFTYPNPAGGEAAAIRFEPGSDCSYRVRVFNVAGEMVSDFSGQCPGGVAHEVQWDVGDLSPGVYYVCLELVAPQGREEALFHAGVVH
jgi:hypothetical protein